MLLVSSHKIVYFKGVFFVLKVQEIRELIKLIDQSSIDEFVYEVDGAKIKMKKNEASAVVTEQIVQQPVVDTIAPTPVPVVAEPKPVVAVAETKVEEATKVEVSEDANLHKITSPMVGTFYQSSSPDADPYVRVGSKLKEDTVVCIVEAMKLFNEIEAEVNGEIVEILVSDGQLVEYGQPLFLVKPE